MKKALVLFLFCASVAAGQIKVGALTLPDSLAIPYLLDCYKHPDTLWESAGGRLPIGVLTGGKEWDASRAWTIIDKWVVIRGHIAENEKTDCWEADGKRFWKIANGFVVPRQPSESDFIVWLKKTNKTSRPK